MREPYWNLISTPQGVGMVKLSLIKIIFMSPEGSSHFCISSSFLSHFSCSPSSLLSGIMISGSRVPGGRVSEFGGPHSNIRSGSAASDHDPSEQYTTNNLPGDRTLRPSRNEVQFSNNPSAGSGYSSGTAGQSTKRLRSNSDERSVSRIQQLLEWLPRASSDDIERIFKFLSCMYQHLE